MTGCSFPLTDCQKVTARKICGNGKRCLGPTGREGNRKENDDLAPRQVIWLYGSFRKHRAAQSTASGHPRSSVTARKICGNGKRCLGQPDSTDAYSPSIPGYMTGCSFPLTDCQKMFRKPRETSNGKRCLGGDRARGKQKGKRRPGSSSGYMAVRELTEASCSAEYGVQPPKVIGGRSENMRQWQRCLGQPDSTDAYSPSIPGYMTGCSFPLTDCQKMFRKPRETSNGKRCLGATGREGNRKENDDLAPRQVIWLYGSLRKHRAAQSTVSSHPRSSVTARKICGNGKRCLGQPDSTDAYSPSIPGYMTGCSFPLTDCQKMFRKPRETSNGKRCQGATGREGNRKENDDLAPRQVIWLYGSFRKHRAAQSTASSHPRSSVAARKICGNGKRCLGQPDSTDAYSPSIPGYMTGCSFPLTDCQKMFRKPRETSNGKRCLGGDRARGKQKGKRRPGSSSGYMAVRELPEASCSAEYGVRPPKVIGGRSENMRQWQRCLGQPDSTDAYSPSIPGYMTGCSFPLTDCQKMFRKPRETSNGKRCLEPTGREGNRKENDDLAPRQVIWLYGSFRKHRAAQSTVSGHPRSSVAARKICGNGKGAWDNRTARMLILLRSRDI